MFKFNADGDELGAAWLVLASIAMFAVGLAAGWVVRDAHQVTEEAPEVAEEGRVLIWG